MLIRKAITEFLERNRTKKEGQAVKVKNLRTNDEVLADLRKYLSKKLAGHSFADPSNLLHACSTEEAVAFARLMSDTIGVPLAELKVYK